MRELSLLGVINPAPAQQCESSCTISPSSTTAAHLGVIRPGWDVEGGVDAQNVGGHCFFSTAYGERLPGWRSWEGMQTAKEQGDRIDMLFDLDQGSMAVCWR